LVALSEANPAFRQRLSDCANHQQVVDWASSLGFDIARRWGQPPSQGHQPMVAIGADGASLPVPLADLAMAGGADLLDGTLAGLAKAGNGLGQNLLSGPCPLPGQERSDPLLATGQLRLELIHSCQFANPPGFWYDPIESEWVLLLQGEAQLRFADEAQARSLKAGDSLLITPGRRHRVEATDQDPGTRWLALFWTD
jgi:cupin 2 domain-containing protein